MNNKPLIREHNLGTDEIIDREMNDDEFAHYELLIAETEAAQKALAEKEENKINALKKLEALGLTLDNLRALGL